MKLSVRQRNAMRLPWVLYFEEARECEGFMSNTPLREIFAHGPRDNRQPPLPRRKCKMKAHWVHVTANDNAFYPGRVQILCWNHLIHRGIYGDMQEWDRTTAWFKEHGYEDA